MITGLRGTLTALEALRCDAVKAGGVFCSGVMSEGIAYVLDFTDALRTSNAVKVDCTNVPKYLLLFVFRLY